MGTENKPFAQWPKELHGVHGRGGGGGGWQGQPGLIFTSSIELPLNNTMKLFSHGHTPEAIELESLEATEEHNILKSWPMRSSFLGRVAEIRSQQRWPHSESDTWENRLDPFAEPFAVLEQ